MSQWIPWGKVVYKPGMKIPTAAILGFKSVNNQFLQRLAYESGITQKAVEHDIEPRENYKRL